MGDQFQLGSGSWWNTSSRNRFETGTAAATSSISTTLNAIASFGWPTEMVDVKSRSSNMDSATASTDEQSSNLQLMGLGPSSQSMDWNQALLSEKDEGSFRALFHEDLSSSYQPESSTAAAASQEHWRQKLYRSENDFKQISHRGFSLDQQRFSSQASSNDSTITSPNRTTAFPVDSATAYSLLPSENQQQSNYHNRPISNYAYPSYPAEMMTSTNKYPPFLRTSPPKQSAGTGSSHFHFTNNTPFWTASDAGSSFFPPLQSQIPIAPSFEPKPKNKAEVRDLSGATKKNSTETPNKRVRNETPTAPPGFKVRKEKMGDRITALQQLVSPFGKTDTASVLSEAIEYIKFLHEQVSALSAPYMKNGAAMQNQQNPDKSDDPEGPRQDLRTRGLCLVPVSSTFPVTHETTVDFWTPTFVGTFR